MNTDEKILLKLLELHLQTLEEYLDKLSEAGSDLDTSQLMIETCNIQKQCYERLK